MVTVSLGDAPLHPRVAPFAAAPVIAIDTETTGLDWWDSKFRVGGWVLYNPDVKADYIAVRHETMFDENEDPAHVADSIRRLAADPSRVWLMHNLGYDENVAATDGVTFAGQIIDTIGLSWSVNPHEPSYALKRLGSKYLDPSAAQQEHRLAEFIKKNKLKRYTQVPVEVMTPYAVQDGKLTWDLWVKASAALPESQMEVAKLEQDWIRLVSKMAGVGIPIDMDLAQEIVDSHLAEAHRLRVWLAKELNYPRFNPNSPSQVVAAAASQGVFLDNAEANTIHQSSLRKDIRLALVRVKQLLHSVGYLESMIKIARGATDGRVHTSLRTTTKTGRLASGNPINLQGLPRRDERTADVHRVREVVRTMDESRFIGFNDFAQIDVRVGTHYAERGRGPLTDVLRDPKGDIHTLVRDEVRAMGIQIDRYQTKRLVFGAQYQIGSESFAEQVSGLDENDEWVGVTKAQAQVWLNAHRKRFPALSHVHSQACTILDQRGYIRLWDGRIIPHNKPIDDPRKAFAWLVQGGGAQLIKRAMVASDRWLQANYPGTNLILQVHDEVIYEGDRKAAKEIGEGIAYHMATQWPGCEIPLYVEPDMGAPSWADKATLGDRFPLDEVAWRLWRAQRP